MPLERHCISSWLCSGWPLLPLHLHLHQLLYIYTRRVGILTTCTVCPVTVDASVYFRTLFARQLSQFPRRRCGCRTGDGGRGREPKRIAMTFVSINDTFVHQTRLLRQKSSNYLGRWLILHVSGSHWNIVSSKILKLFGAFMRVAGPSTLLAGCPPGPLTLSCLSPDWFCIKIIINLAKHLNFHRYIVA